MTDDDIAPPEPKEIDSQKWLEWKEVMDRAILRAHPLEEFGEVGFLVVDRDHRRDVGPGCAHASSLRTAATTSSGSP